MQTIGGGTIQYVGVELLPCPEQPRRFGQVVGPARLDVLWRDRVVESFALRGGDELLVADRAEVAPGTALVERGDRQRALRAAIPEGVEAVVRWSERIEVRDELTGIASLPSAEPVAAVTEAARAGFDEDRRPGGTESRAITVELLVDQAPIATATIRHCIPIAPTGAVVRRGDRIAWISRGRRMRELETGIETVRAFLDARRLAGEPTALVAPRDATVAEIDQHWIVLRAPDGCLLRLRRPPGSPMLVEIGDSVIAGDPLTDGERNHHALRHAWGDHRLGEHIMDELTLILGDKVPRVYWSLALRAMLQTGELRGIAAIASARRARSPLNPLPGTPGAEPGNVRTSDGDTGDP